MHRQEGFTLIELMIVILIIGILVGIAVPVFLAARGSADEKACLSNQRNFLTGADIFASETGRYPGAATHEKEAIQGPSGKNSAAWPGGYYDGKIAAGAPACPASGVVEVGYTTDGTVRPTTVCRVEASGAEKHGSPGK